MARTSGIKVINKFQRGLVTETTGLNFPEDAVTDADNVVFEPESIARRRYGIDFEQNYTALSPTGSDESAISEYYWRNAAGNANYNFVVTQIGTRLYFYSASGSSLSGGATGGNISLNEMAVSGSPSVDTVPCSFTSGSNYLFVSHPFCDPFYVEYSPADDSFTATAITLEIRDFEGVTDNYDIDERRTTLSNAHKYNLYNQGWYATASINDDPENVQVVDNFKEKMDTYPSNADIWWLFKNAEGFFRPRTVANTIAIGNTEAPKGHYILEAFYQDRSGVSGVTGISVTTASYWRPSTIAFFAGRVWYAGVANRKFSSNIYFSQIAESDDQFGRCYQANDPTSEHAADLLPTDGGVVKIPEIGTIYKMIPIQSSLLIFASNGVWSIAGSEGLGFRANDYSVRKISSVGAINSSSFVDVEGFAMWWAKDGIYGVTTDNLGQFQVQSVTDQTIKGYYDDIPVSSKQYAKGAYNSRDKIIQWVFRSAAPGVTSRNKYDRVLCYNLISSAFYTYSININAVVLKGIVAIEGVGTTTSQSAVIEDGSDTIVTIALDDVVVDTTEQQEFSSVFKYLVQYTQGAFTFTHTFAEEYDTRYRDWYQYNDSGYDYDSYFVSGYDLSSQGTNYMQSNYTHIYMNEEQDSSVYVQGVFDWSSSSASGKWSTAQQGYNSTRTNRSVRVSRLKVRGKGRTLQLRFASESGKPFNIIGWSMFETGNSIP